MKIADYLNDVHEEYGSTSVNKIMKEPYVSLSNSELEREFRTAREALEGVKLGGNRAKLKAWTDKVKELAGKIAKERKEMESQAKASKGSAKAGEIEIDLSDPEKIGNWLYGLRSDAKFYSSTLNHLVKLIDKGQLKSLVLVPEEENKDWIKFSVIFNGQEDDLMKKKLRKKDMKYSIPDSVMK